MRFHAGHAAEHMVHKYGSLAGKGVQGMARGGMGAKATLDTANNASKRTRSALEQARESGQFTGSDKDIRMAAAGSWMKAMGMQLGQKIGDSAHKTFTGLDKQHLGADGHNNGFLKVGQDFVAEGGRVRKATYADVVAAGHQKVADAGNLDSLKNGSLGKHFVQTDKDRNSGSGGTTGGATEAPEENTSQIKLPQNEDRNGFGVK